MALPLVSFDHDTVVGAVPPRLSIAAALPPSERSGYLRGAYSQLIPEKSDWEEAEVTASHWADAYVARRDLLENASERVSSLRNVIPVARRTGAKDFSGAALLTGISEDDEWMLATLFDGRTTFSPGTLLLLENRNAWRLSEVAQELDVSYRQMGDAMNIFAAPRSWRIAGDFETLMYQALRCPANHREAIRTMRATRALSPSARFLEADTLRQRYSLTELEEFVASGLNMEYLP